MVNKSFGKLFRKWTLSIDRVLLVTIFTIISIGVWISIASTPAVAMKLGLPPFYFVKHHIMTVPFAIFIIIFISFLHPRYIRRLGVIGYLLCIFLLVATLFMETEIKGAKRWLNILGFSLQPSEFLKPVLTVMTAWFVSEQYVDRKFPGILLSLISIAIVSILLLLQPDVGMTVIVIGTWFAQLFISGLSIFMIITFLITSMGALVGGYFMLPHFADRIDRFIMRDRDDVDLYQIQKSIEAFKNGGFWGKGPGEGIVKTLVPDSHSDFVFSVIGEEFGFIVCIILVMLFVVLIIRSLSKVINSPNIFNFCTVFGIVFQISMQVFINVCSSLNLIPTKGMTLPFISYGGSSMLSTAISLGILLALTKRNAIIKDTF